MKNFTKSSSCLLSILYLELKVSLVQGSQHVPSSPNPSRKLDKIFKTLSLFSPKDISLLSSKNFVEWISTSEIHSCPAPERSVGTQPGWNTSNQWRDLTNVFLLQTLRIPEILIIVSALFCWILFHVFHHGYPGSVVDVSLVKRVKQQCFSFHIKLVQLHQI